MSKKQKATDPSRFEGNGISYRGKLIGSEDVAEARGDKMCQETIQKLKGALKASGQHKQRIFVNVTLEGLKIIDGASLNVLHTHPVHQISFISRDVKDSRAFGYVFGSGDGSHKFYGIKTANSAENVVLALRDLFQTVYEMKKQEMEEAKAKAAAGTDTQSEEKDTEKTEASTEAKPAESADNVEQVAINNAPVTSQDQQKVVANLLDLEDQVDSILQGIEQIQRLDFEDLTSEDAPGQTSCTTTTTTTTSSPESTAAPVSVSLTDPWGMPAAAESSAEPVKASSSSSALSDLEGLTSGPPPSSNPFSGMQAFPVAPASTSAAFFSMGQPNMPQSVMAQPGMAQPGMGQPAMGQSSMPFGQQGMMGSSVGLPVTKDPFGDPFSTSQAQQQMMGATTGGFGMQPAFSTPFPATVVGPTPAQPFPGAMAAPGAPGMQPGFGRASPSFSPFGAPPAPAAGMGTGMPQGEAAANPFQTSDSLLQPSMSGGQEEKSPVSPAHASLFSDLLDIKTAGGAESAKKTPKEMFQPPPKKSMNEMKGGAGAGAPQTNSSPFGDPFFSSPVNGKPSDAQS